MGKQQWVVNESESIPPNISTWVLNYLVDFQWLKRTSPTRYKKKRKMKFKFNILSDINYDLNVGKGISDFIIFLYQT